MLFGNSNIKNTFIRLFSVKVLYVYVWCKTFQSIYHIFSCFSKYPTKTTWKCLNAVLKKHPIQNKFKKKKKNSIKNLPNVFFGVKNYFLFYQEQFPNKSYFSWANLLSPSVHVGFWSNRYPKKCPRMGVSNIWPNNVNLACPKQQIVGPSYKFV